MKPIAHIENAMDTKFGIPRQSGLVEGLQGTVVFEPEYRDAQALRGLEEFSHIWLLWEFSETKRTSWSPTVRPPRLGGNTRMGVFATRSPFRPNPIGLSCVKLIGVQNDPVRGHVLRIAGGDLMNGTPIYDIKPYLPYTDCHPEATGGFTDVVERQTLQVEIPPDLESKIVPEEREALSGILAQDPRPSYQQDPERIYGMRYGGRDIRFRVSDGVLRVVAVDGEEAEQVL
ncbi:MAG: tRNA (N6-threonylcarbamoyladenosine(37)-N6)-methyltransferase TrmO [Lachnospiraceae bacterium]|nr:tRNA (N6-threonylcarbamoyladenosine(37)-N6)-methyltransferase TrmO [Lachnospiraceae bacterium]